MSERLRTPRMIGFRDRAVEPYRVDITLLRIVATCGRGSPGAVLGS